jgi:hypothetical protein
VTLTLPQNEGEWVRGGLDAQLAQIGRPLVQWPGATSSYDAQSRALTIDLPGAAQVEVYPDSDTWLHLAGPPQVAASDRGQLIHLTLRSDAPLDLTPSVELRVFPKGGGDPLTLSSLVPPSTPE